MPDATPPLATDDPPPAPPPDAGNVPPRRGVTRLQKVLIGVGLATVVIGGATATALNSPARYSDAEACAEATPLITEAANAKSATAMVDGLFADLGRFESAQRRAVPDGEVAAALADLVATMHEYQRTKDAENMHLAIDTTFVAVACGRRK
jgi:hypothetical protein